MVEILVDPRPVDRLLAGYGLHDHVENGVWRDSDDVDVDYEPEEAFKVGGILVWPVFCEDDLEKAKHGTGFGQVLKDEANGPVLGVIIQPFQCLIMNLIPHNHRDQIEVHISIGELLRPLNNRLSLDKSERHIFRKGADPSRQKIVKKVLQTLALGLLSFFHPRVQNKEDSGSYRRIFT